MDNVAKAAQNKHMEDADSFLTENLKVLGKFFVDWRIIPSMNKTETMYFHLNNKQAKKKV